MDAAERVAEVYLGTLGAGDVVHEPDGNVPPDFVLGGRIAVEVRRLNQHYVVNEASRSLEEDSVPIRQGFSKLLDETRPIGMVGSWFVMFTIHRPVASWRELRPLVKAALLGFAKAPVDAAWRVPIASSVELTFLRSTEDFGRPFVLGGYTDRDAGGWVVAEVIRNMTAYAAEKAEKVRPYRHKYAEWWLVLVDYIALAREEADVREHYTRPADWDRIILLSPSGDRAYAI